MPKSRGKISSATLTTKNPTLQQLDGGQSMMNNCGLVSMAQVSELTRAVDILQEREILLQKTRNDDKILHKSESDFLRKRIKLLESELEIKSNLIQAKTEEVVDLRLQTAVHKSRCNYLTMLLLRSCKKLLRLQTNDITVAEIEGIWDLVYQLDAYGDNPNNVTLGNEAPWLKREALMEPIYRHGIKIISWSDFELDLPPNFWNIFKVRTGDPKEVQYEYENRVWAYNRNIGSRLEQSMKQRYNPDTRKYNGMKDNMGGAASPSGIADKKSAPSLKQQFSMMARDGKSPGDMMDRDQLSKILDVALRIVKSGADFEEAERMKMATTIQGEMNFGRLNGEDSPNDGGDAEQQALYAGIDLSGLTTSQQQSLKQKYARSLVNGPMYAREMELMGADFDTRLNYRDGIDEDVKNLSPFYMPDWRNMQMYGTPNAQDVQESFKDASGSSSGSGDERIKNTSRDGNSSSSGGKKSSKKSSSDANTSDSDRPPRGPPSSSPGSHSHSKKEGRHRSEVGSEGSHMSEIGSVGQERDVAMRKTDQMSKTGSDKKKNRITWSAMENDTQKNAMVKEKQVFDKEDFDKKKGDREPNDLAFILKGLQCELHRDSPQHDFDRDTSLDAKLEIEGLDNMEKSRTKLSPKEEKSRSFPLKSALKKTSPEKSSLKKSSVSITKTSPEKRSLGEFLGAKASTEKNPLKKTSSEKKSAKKVASESASPGKARKSDNKVLKEFYCEPKKDVVEDDGQRSKKDVVDSFVDRKSPLFYNTNGFLRLEKSMDRDDLLGEAEVRKRDEEDVDDEENDCLGEENVLLWDEDHFDKNSETIIEDRHEILRRILEEVAISDDENDPFDMDRKNDPLDVGNKRDVLDRQTNNELLDKQDKSDKDSFDSESDVSAEGKFGPGEYSYSFGKEQKSLRQEPFRDMSYREEKSVPFQKLLFPSDSTPLPWISDLDIISSESSTSKDSEIRVSDPLEKSNPIRFGSDVDSGMDIDDGGKPLKSPSHSKLLNTSPSRLHTTSRRANRSPQEAKVNGSTAHLRATRSALEVVTSLAEKDSPTSRVNSPFRKADSPVWKVGSRLSGKATSPIGKESSPTRHSDSPSAQKLESPSRRQVDSDQFHTPLSKLESPCKTSTLDKTILDKPSKPIKSPVREQRSPVKHPESSGKKTSLLSKILFGNRFSKKTDRY